MKLSAMSQTSINHFSYTVIGNARIFVRKI